MPKKKFMFTESADLANFNYKGIYVSLTIDIRKWAVTKRDEAGHPLEHDQLQELPIVLRIAKDSKRLYLPIGEKCKWNNWLEMCKHEQSTRVRSDSEKRAQLKKHITNLKPIVYEMADAGTFSLARIKDRYNGISNDDVTIYTIWDEYIQEKKNEGEFGTAGVGKDTRNRFIKDNGKEVKFSDINFDFVQNWVKTMQDAELSSTYIGINLRTFRTMVNRAIRKGYVKDNTEEMFKDSGYNQMESRKDCFMSVDENGKELFIPRDKNALFRDLGLFLFMYFANGQNLADTLRLEYDNLYFSSQGQQLRFQRHKTKRRSKGSSEVLFPVTPEVQKIIERYGNKPKMGERVFPILDKSKTPEQELWVIQRYNKYIRKHMKKVAELLKLEQTPTSTWARHSFATNLNNSGFVPREYIKSSMAHSSDNDVTSKYIGAYPLPMMQEYNSYLLKVLQKVSSKEDLLQILKDMSEEERAALMEEASK